MRIRKEEPKDREAVYRLVREAFASAAHADGTEQDLVEALRQDPAFVPALSLVAEADGEPVGHILLTEAAVGGETVLALAPLSVKPAFQRQGVGTALIRAAHGTAAALGYGWSVVLGSEIYYPRLGYAPAAQFGIAAPPGIPAENLMAVRLREDAAPLHGTLVYPAAFGI